MSRAGILKSFQDFLGYAGLNPEQYSSKKRGLRLWIHFLRAELQGVVAHNWISDIPG
jgi:hypothetical protein